MSIKVMLIEDELEICEILTSIFEDEGFVVVSLADGTDAIRELEKHQPQILIVDQMMPTKKGTEIIADVRAAAAFSKLPIIMLSALSFETDKVRALETGADDFVAKPFQAKELCARIRALVRRIEVSPVAEKMDYIVFADLKIDFVSHRVLINQDEVPLTLTEFKILTQLLKKREQVLTREDLRVQALDNLNVSDRTIDVHMSALRKKLGGIGEHIHTVRGVGYRFSGTTEVITPN